MQMAPGTPAAAKAPAAAPAGRTVRPEFTGSAAEYFRIWIVNLLFTLLTFGIYSAWAKVRKKRYFYGSTRFDGSTFDYFASPRAILNGRVVAFAVFVLYALAGELYPMSKFGFWALAVVFLPWLVVRALGFNARNSAWRGLRFDFTARTKDAARVYIGNFLVVLLTAGLAWPWFVARQKAFVVSHHALGTSRFGCELPARSFYWIYLRAGLLFLVLVVPAIALVSFAIARIGPRADLGSAMFFLPVIPVYVAYALVYAYSQARTTNLMWNNTYGPGLRFSSSLSAFRLARLYLGNVVAAACSAGLLIPWTVVRTMRYRLEQFAVIVEGEPVHEANPALARVGATGQELGDFFNLDLGL
jgi:uncharacterized membrane protein YjgN (DUF898 family)